MKLSRVEAVQRSLRTRIRHIFSYFPPRVYGVLAQCLIPAHLHQTRNPILDRTPDKTLAKNKRPPTTGIRIRDTQKEETPLVLSSVLAIMPSLRLARLSF